MHRRVGNAVLLTGLQTSIFRRRLFQYATCPTFSSAMALASGRRFKDIVSPMYFCTCSRQGTWVKETPEMVPMLGIQSNTEVAPRS